MARGKSRVVVLLGAAALSLGCERKAPPLAYQLSTNAPQDQPVTAGGRAQVEALAAATAPYVEKARATYPGARKRYLEGLPAGQVFFAVARVGDASGAREQVFILVSEIKNGRIAGRIASEVLGVRGYKQGDAYEFPETELIDWLISHPDGTEEGNVVGKFLDSWQKNGHPR